MLRVAAGAALEHLDRDVASGDQVAAAVHDAHPAHAEHLADLDLVLQLAAFSERYRAGERGKGAL